MAGFTEVGLDLTDVKKGFKAMRRASRDPRPLFRRQRGPFRQDMKQHFAKQEGPHGPWPGRAQSSIDKMLGQGGKRKNLTKKGKVRKGAQRRLGDQLGRLKSWFQLKANRREMRISSKAYWSLAIQEGAVVGHGAIIPPRPFLWISSPYLTQFTDDYAKFVVEAWEARK